MSKPVYRSLSVERHLAADRDQIYAAAVATTPEQDLVLSDEPPWRRVTTRSDGDLDCYEICVAIIETPSDARIVSVSAVIGPESAPGSFDTRLEAVKLDLNRRADAIAAHER